MKKIVTLIGVILICWGVWVFVSGRPAEIRNTMLAACAATFDNYSAEAMSGLACNNAAYKSAGDLERNALLAIIIGVVPVAMTAPTLKSNRR